MMYELFTVKDCCSGLCGEINIFNNRAMAERWFDGLCRESKIASDLQLFYLGTYDLEQGIIKNKVEFIKGGVL